MALDKTRPRHHSLILAHDDRLFVDPADDTYYVYDPDDDDVEQVVPTVVTAIGELVADGYLENGAADGPNGLTAVDLTTAGVALLEEWNG